MNQEQTVQAYKSATEYILEIPKFCGKHTTEETRAFYEFLGEPCRYKQIIHVAGTNGKGSVCTYLRTILEEAGHHTAVFVSPHLVSIRERFLFDGEKVSREAFLQAFQIVQDKLAQYGSDYHPSFFEYLFFMFLVMEQTKEADYIVLETGLGGRLDATNIMPQKLLCVITKIGFDHMEYLGDTVAQIAAEKAGIIQKGVPVVFAADKVISEKVIEQRAKELEAPAYPVRMCDVKIEGIRDKNIAFSFHSVYYNFVSVNLATTALYQVENASLVLRAVEVLNQLGHGITLAQIQRGLQRAHWAGRMEEILPDVYVDGAHNEDGVQAFLQTVREQRKGQENHLLFAVVQDKQCEAMLKLIAQSGLFEKITITKAGGSRATSPKELLGVLRKYYSGECNFDESPEHAFDRLLADQKEDVRLYIAGSLYLAGQIKAHIGRNSDD